MAENPALTSVELSRQEIETIARDHLHHGEENMSLAKMVEREGLNGSDFRYLAALRYKRAGMLMRIALPMVHTRNVPHE